MLKLMERELQNAISSMYVKLSRETVEVLQQVQSGLEVIFPDDDWATYFSGSHPSLHEAGTEKGTHILHVMKFPSLPGRNASVRCSWKAHNLSAPKDGNIWVNSSAISAVSETVTLRDHILCSVISNVGDYLQHRYGKLKGYFLTFALILYVLATYHTEMYEEVLPSLTPADSVADPNQVVLMIKSTDDLIEKVKSNFPCTEVSHEQIRRFEHMLESELSYTVYQSCKNTDILEESVNMLLERPNTDFALCDDTIFSVRWNKSETYHTNIGDLYIPVGEDYPYVSRIKLAWSLQSEGV